MQKHSKPESGAAQDLALSPERLVQHERDAAVLSAHRVQRRLERHLGKVEAAEVLSRLSGELDHGRSPSTRRPYDPDRDPIPPCPHPGGIVDATGFDAFDFALSVVRRLGRPKTKGQQWRSPFLAIGSGKARRWLELDQASGRYREVSRTGVEVVVRRELDKHTFFAERDNVRDTAGRSWNALPCGQHVGVTVALVREVVAEMAQLPCVGFDSVEDALSSAGGGQ